MKPTDPAAMRRLPQQARSQERINVILDAAARVFVESGYDGATTNAIAKEAGTSIGSLYRFFEDKKSIYDALTDRFFKKMVHMLKSRITIDLLRLPMREIVAKMFDVFDRFLLEEPAFEAVVLYADSSPELHQRSLVMKSNMAEVLAEFFRARAPTLSVEKRILIARTCIEIVNAFQRMSLAHPRGRRKEIREEFARAISCYLEDALR